MAEPGVAARAQRRARQRGASRRVRKALAAAGIVESGNQHTKYSRVGSGDRDSVGFLQQRPSQGWGPAGESVEKDTDDFLDRAMKLNPTFKGSAGQLAQAVQRSAYPGKYDAVSAQAEKILGGSPGEAIDAMERMVTNPGRAPSVTPARDTGLTAAEAAKAVLAARAGSGKLPSLKSSRLKEMSALMQQSAGRTPVQFDPGEMPTLSEVRGRSAAGGTSGKSGTAKITGPNPGRIKPEVKDFMERIAGEVGETVVGSDGTGHSYRTVNGNVSEHSTGNATDIPAAGAKLLRLGRAALIAAGMPRAQALKAKGGLYNVNGHQIIFATNQGGNHHDHLHISAKSRNKRAASRRRR